MAFITVEQVIRAKAHKDVIQVMLDNRIIFFDNYAADIELAVAELIKHKNYETDAQIYVECWNALEMKEQHQH